MRKVGTCVLVAAAVVLLVGVRARALINPNFTPLHLVRQAQLIAVLKFSKADSAGKVVGEVQQALKGKAEAKTITIDLAATGQEAITEHAVKMVEAAAAEQALFFTGEFAEEGAEEGPLAGGFVHVSGKWLSLYREKDGSWGLDKIDSHMEGTWAGGTDMLLHCINYILTDPEPNVPVASGSSWDRKEKAGRVEGKVHGLQAVDLAGDGRLYLYAASDAGDRLLAYDPKKKAFEDLTAARGLKARSKQAVWGDFNGDGRADLASWDGSALSLWQQGGDGSFSAQPVKVGEALKAGCVGLAVLDVGRKGRPGLLASTPAAPVLLVPGDDGALQARPLAVKPDLMKDLGRPSGCLVADFDDDHLGDILQPFEQGSLFYKGRPAGAFAEPVRWEVGLGKQPATAHVADFDHDGRLDVFVAAEDYCKLFHHLGPGAFADRLYISGEIAYISQPNAIGAQVCDVNNDGRQDVLIWYSNLPPQIFFNRGYRSFGHAHDIDLGEQGLLEEARNGQQWGLIADLNGDGAQDMVVVVPGGDVWVFFRTVYLAQALAARAILPPGGPFAGPLTVTAWAEKRCLGAWNVVAGSAEAFFGRIDAGPVELRWQFPDGPAQKKEVILEEGPLRIALTPAK